MKNKGITLIALVITIIVLLILVGISIATLTGENGIITQANKARGETEEEGAREKVAVEVLGSRGADGKIDIDKLNENLRNIQGILGLPITELPAIVTVDGYEFLINSYGNVIKLLKPGEISKSTQRDNYSDGIGTATIPEGFRVSEKEGEQTIDKGIVVIGPDGSEFVWIPVETAVAKSEEEGSINKAIAVNLGTESEPRYRGLEYEPLSSDPEETEMKVVSGCTSEAYEYFREPDIVSYDYNIENLNIINNILGTNLSSGEQFKERLQKEYNEMIESVSKYGGFYYGRYEASESDGKVVSKAGNEALTAEESSGNTWYGLYAKCNTYTTSSVKSNMWYVGQFFALVNHVERNNFFDPEFTLGCNASTKTGVEPTDVIYNVYDLVGCRNEWTLGISKSNSNNVLYRRPVRTECATLKIYLNNYMEKNGQKKLISLLLIVLSIFLGLDLCYI